MLHQPIEPPRRDADRSRASAGLAALRVMFADIAWDRLAVFGALLGFWVFAIVTTARHWHEVFG